MNHWVARTRWRASLLAVGGLSACGGDVIVARTGIEAGAEPTGSGGRIPSGAAGGALGSGGGGGALPPRVNDPCNAAGYVEFRPAEPSSAYAAITGYVVAFDPPRLLGSKELTKTGFLQWSATVDHLALEGAPSCEELRSAFVFLVARDEDGSGSIVNGSLNAEPNASSGCEEALLRAENEPGPFERVRVFGMTPGGTSVDGPVTMVRQSGVSRETWIAPLDGALAGCAPGYVVIAVAHRGGLLVSASAAWGY